MSETQPGMTQAVTYAYSGFGEMTSVVHPQSGTITRTYDAKGRLETQTQSGGTESYTYNALGQVSTVTHADNTTTTSTYDLQGRVLTQGGSASYPLRYEYDAMGRLWKLHTYRDAPPDLTQDGDVTTWNYVPGTSALASKRDATNHGTSYTYDAGGRLETRTWQRGVVTTYSYDGVGRLTGIVYDDGTPGVTHVYDRAGRRTSTTDAAGTHAFTYDAVSGGQLASWSVSGSGVWSGLSVAHTYTSGQRSSRATSLGSISLPTVGYTYDATSGRMASVSADGVTATYRYNANTGWNDGVTYSTGLSSTRAMDALGRLDAITWSVGGTVVSGHHYTLNAMNRRTAAQRQDGSKWNYGYNDRGEVTSAAKEDAIGIPEPGKQYGFAFDGLGNRTSSTVSSLPDNQTLRTTGYTANALNQYEQINHPQPGWLVLRGSVNAAASVSIDGEPPTVRSGPLWHYETSVNNSSGPVRRVAEIIATRPDGGRNNSPVTTKRQGATFIPPPVESPTYDLDGNQTSDARWTYTWDGENRMVAAEEKNISVSVAAGVSLPSVTTRQRIENTYDSQNRRIRKVVKSFSSANPTWSVTSDLVFLYDQWNMIAEIGSESSSSASVPLAAPALLRSYEWGLDVSGTLDGAGGVGGQLIQRHYPSSQIPHLSTHAPCYDGNGNVTELVNLATGTLSGRYEYGPFGETISVDGGAVAEANPFRFSTKYLDGETGLIDYVNRIYDVPNARWLSRDPIEEEGGINLYGFVGNDPVGRIDVLGMWDTKPHMAIIDELVAELGLEGQCGCCNVDIGKHLKKTSNVVDGLTSKGKPWRILRFLKAQGTSMAHYHAMRKPKQSVEDAEKEYEALLSSLAGKIQTLTSQSPVTCRHMVDALTALGSMIHAISDYHSPAHSGFQEWPGIFGADDENGWPGTQLRHGGGKNSLENMDAYEKSPIRRIRLRQDLMKRLTEPAAQIKKGCKRAKS